METGQKHRTFPFPCCDIWQKKITLAPKSMASLCPLEMYKEKSRNEKKEGSRLMAMGWAVMRPETPPKRSSPPAWMKNHKWKCRATGLEPQDPSAHLLARREAKVPRNKRSPTHPAHESSVWPTLIWWSEGETCFKWHLVDKKMTGSRLCCDKSKN